MCKRILVIILLIFSPFGFVQAAPLSEKMSGRILLQVESKGEAWYVNPANLHRYFLGRPEDALNLMRELGVGILNQDLNKIPVNLDFQVGVDSDGDGLADNLEIAIGTNPNLTDSDGDGFSDRQELSTGFNPNGPGKLPLDSIFSAKQKGKIFLQVEAHGEAWYVNPTNGMRYFLGRPADAFSLMRSLGLGITNANLALIPAETANYNASDLELKMFDAINQQRISYGKKPLVWNGEVAKVAREHSQNIADEDKVFSGEGRTCDFPIIHHEGLIFGNYNSDRLNNRGIYYFSASGENIALVPTVSTTVTFSYNDLVKSAFDSCSDRRAKMDTDFKTRLDGEADINKKLEIIKTEDVMRKEIYDKEGYVKISEQKWYSLDKVVSETVTGWMNSPGHKANILDENFDQSGIGVADVDGYLISTQSFIKRATCGYKDSACCQENKNSVYCYSPLTCEQDICR